MTSVSLLEVDAMLQRLAAQQAAVVIDEDRCDVLGETDRRRVRRDQQIRRSPEDVVRRQRLLLEHVEDRTGEMSVLERRAERRFVDDAAASGVDEDGARRQRAEEVGVDEMARTRGRRHDAYEVIEIRRELA